MKVPIVEEGWRLIFPVMGAALLFLAWAGRSQRGGAWVAGGVFLVAGLLLVNFFRDPERNPERVLKPNEVICPADGVIVVLGEAEEPFFLKEKALHIVIFMNVFDNHVQRAPFDGRVVKKVYHPGKFLAAFVETASLENEQSHLWVELKGRKGESLVFKQIAGLLARRVVTSVPEGAEIERGSRIGRILLGSRVDVFLPVGFRPAVRMGQKVKAGVTVLGELP